MPLDIGSNPDVHSASAEYAKRFSGAVGEWMLEVQTQHLFRHLGNRTQCSVLDVGGGHGQVAEPLAKNGYQVTVVGSEEKAFAQLDHRPLLQNLQRVIAPLETLPFPDRSFDIVTSFRIVSHYEDWKRLLRELCRVSRDLVVIDYPTYQSVNVIAEALFSLKKGVEKNTRRYTTFWDREIENECRESGFTRALRTGQFVFPMALHRGLKTVGLSKALEKGMAAMKADRLCGSPVILSMRKQEL